MITNYLQIFIPNSLCANHGKLAGILSAASPCHHLQQLSLLTLLLRCLISALVHLLLRSPATLFTLLLP
jgi:hypothetical protein